MADPEVIRDRASKLLGVELDLDPGQPKIKIPPGLIYSMLPNARRYHSALDDNEKADEEIAKLNEARGKRRAALQIALTEVAGAVTYQPVRGGDSAHFDFSVAGMGDFIEKLYSDKTDADTKKEMEAKLKTVQTLLEEDQAEQKKWLKKFPQQKWGSNEDMQKRFSKLLGVEVEVKDGMVAYETQPQATAEEIKDKEAREKHNTALNKKNAALQVKLASLAGGATYAPGKGQMDVFVSSMKDFVTEYEAEQSPARKKKLNEKLDDLKKFLKSYEDDREAWFKKHPRKAKPEMREASITVPSEISSEQPEYFSPNLPSGMRGSSWNLKA